MKALQHPMIVGLVPLAMVWTFASPASAQYGYERRGTGRQPDTPQLMVGTCHASPRQLGVDASKELRDRIQNENNERDLYVIPNKTVNDALVASGYSPDSALNIADLAALGKLVHANEIIDCDASKTGSGVHMEARMFLAVDATQTQPLAPVDAKDFGDAAKALERENTAARKQLDGYQKCRNDSRDGKLQDAVKDALGAIRDYPQSTLARICLAAAYADPKMGFPPDSVLAVTNEILKIDPANVSAIQFAIGAYDRKGDKANETTAMQQLYKLQPQDQTLAMKIVDALAAQGDTAGASKALGIVNDMLKTNPGDPESLQQKWKLQARLGMLHDALATGELMVRSDTSLADTAYFNRQIAMASTDSNWAKVAEYAGQAGKKFVKDPRFPYLQGVALHNVNQLPAAAQAFRQALALNPKDTNVLVFLASTYGDLGQSDSVVKIADAAIAAGGSKDKWGPMLIKPAQDLFTKAGTDTANAAQYYGQALTYAQHADSVAPSKFTKFFTAVSAFQVGLSIYRDMSTNKSKDCDQAKHANDLFTTAQIDLPDGGSVSPQTATSIMQYLPQLSDATDKMVKAYCKK